MKNRLVPAAFNRALEEIRVADEGGGKAAGRGGKDLFGRTLLDNAAVSNEHQVIGNGHGLVAAVGNKDGGHAELALKAHYLAPKIPPEDGIDRGEGLVEEQHIGLDHQCAGQGHPLALSAGQGVDAPRAVLRQPYN